MTSKSFVRTRATNSVYVEEPLVHTHIPSLAALVDKIISYNLPLLCTLMAVYSTYTMIPYAGTILNIVTLELSPVVVLVTNDVHVRRHHAIVAVCACISLFVMNNPQRQVFLSYPTYVALVHVAVLSTSSIPKPRHSDTLLLAGVLLAILSALLLRNVMTGQHRLVQAVEFTLLTLSVCAYGFMHSRRAAAPAQPG